MTIFRSRTSIYAVLAAVATAAALAGCQDDAGSGTTAPATRAAATAHPATSTGHTAAAAAGVTSAQQFCSLLSTDTLNSVAHIHVDSVEMDTTGNAYNCLFHFGGTAHLPLIEISLNHDTDPQAHMRLDKQFYHHGTNVGGLGVAARSYSNSVEVALDATNLLTVNLAFSDVHLGGGDLKTLAVRIARAEVPRVRL